MNLDGGPKIPISLCSNKEETFGIVIRFFGGFRVGFVST